MQAQGEPIHFDRYHGLGNDYLVSDARKFKGPWSTDQIQLICHRNFGVGSDGILFGPLPSDKAFCRLEIWNPDGSEAEKSGNGLRIFSRYLYDQGLVKAKESFGVETLCGVSICEVDPEKDVVSVQLGTVSFDSDQIPIHGEKREVIKETLQFGTEFYTYCGATIGNPHAVVLVDEPTKELACRIGPLIENHLALFPNRTNVQFLKVLDRNNIEIQIWERGAGYTLASGSSSSACAAVAKKLGLCDSDLHVHCPGGVIDIRVDDEFGIVMTAPVVHVCQVTLSDTFLDTKLPVQ